MPTPAASASQANIAPAADSAPRTSFGGPMGFSTSLRGSKRGTSYQAFDTFVRPSLDQPAALALPEKAGTSPQLASPWAQGLPSTPAPQWLLVPVRTEIATTPATDDVATAQQLDWSTRNPPKAHNLVAAEHSTALPRSGLAPNEAATAPSQGYVDAVQRPLAYGKKEAVYMAQSPDFATGALPAPGPAAQQEAVVFLSRRPAPDQRLRNIDLGQENEERLTSSAKARVQLQSAETPDTGRRGTQQMAAMSGSPARLASQGIQYLAPGVGPTIAAWPPAVVLMASAEQSAAQPVQATSGGAAAGLRWLQEDCHWAAVLLIILAIAAVVGAAAALIVCLKRRLRHVRLDSPPTSKGKCVDQSPYSPLNLRVRYGERLSGLLPASLDLF